MACGCLGVSEEAKLRLLEATPFYAYLEASEMRLLAKAFVRRSFARGKALPDSPFYLMLRGEVEVRQGGSALCRKANGSFFSRRAGIVEIDENERRERARGRKSAP